MSCQAGPGIEPRPSALKASALPIELTWQSTEIYLKIADRDKRLLLTSEQYHSKIRIVYLLGRNS